MALGLDRLTRGQRLAVGGLLLLTVDIIWVVSSELTQYIFHDLKYSKPYFSTYTKNSMFVVYLSGFLFWRPWLHQCRHKNKTKSAGRCGSPDRDVDSESEKLLSDPIYVPVNYNEENHSGSDSDEFKNAKVVRFSSLSEVRQLPDDQAGDALLARLSYTSSLKAEEKLKRLENKLTIKQVIKLSLVFSVLFFGGNISYQVALNDTNGAALVNVLSSTSSLFTTVLSGVFPSSPCDRFTFSKLLAVCFSIGGVAMVSYSDSTQGSMPLGAFWALVGALCYAVYLVMLRRRVDHEDKIDIPMFFGFVGFYILILAWPVIFVLDATKAETFDWPDKREWLLLIVNGLVGTVLSELLWLWGCFLTSALIGTLSLSLTTPLTMFADLIVKNNTEYSWMFYVGSVPIFLSFFAVCFLSHYDTWDPVLIVARRCFHWLCRRRRVNMRLREIGDQTERLLPATAGDV